MVENGFIDLICRDLEELKKIPLTEDFFNAVFCISPLALKYIPDQFKTQDMCNTAVEVDT